MLSEYKFTTANFNVNLSAYSDYNALFITFFSEKGSGMRSSVSNATVLVSTSYDADGSGNRPINEFVVTNINANSVFTSSVSESGAKHLCIIGVK